jgi:hypothetical protein
VGPTAFWKIGESRDSPDDDDDPISIGDFLAVVDMGSIDTDSEEDEDYEESEAQFEDDEDEGIEDDEDDALETEELEQLGRDFAEAVAHELGQLAGADFDIIHILPPQEHGNGNG